MTEETETRGRKIVVRQSGYKLVVLEGSDRGRWLPVNGRRLTIGSAPDNDFVLSDRTVSRKHLLVKAEDGGVVLCDLGSRNGSFVQGTRFKEVMVGLGTEVTVGCSLLKLLPQEEPVRGSGAREGFGSMLGRDPKMRELFAVLADVANSTATVLIEGETGTGKELLAEELHSHSPRRKGPIVVFDCGAVPRELLESALFGHVRGAFTGATSDRLGAFREAEGGTLFLDEIGELALDMQPALLRALDKRMIRPVGSSGYQSVDVRVVAATNRDLKAEVAAGRFREDLYYRLAVIVVTVPSLCERSADIPLLAETFIRMFGGHDRLRYTPEELERLREHSWPGNVRQLRNVIERACLLGQMPSRDELLDESGETPPPIGSPTLDIELPYKQAKARVLGDFDRQYFSSLRERHGGNLSAAARAAQLDRKYLRDLMRRLEAK